VVGKINVEIAKASKDNGDHFDEVVQDATNSIIDKILGTNRQIDDGLQETPSQVIDSNENNTQSILSEQNKNFSKTINWIDTSINRLMKEVSNKDTNIILQAQEDNLSDAVNLIINSISNVLQEVRLIKRSNSFDDLYQFQ
jgi:flagellar hook-basal body complex protein FliE